MGRTKGKQEAVFLHFSPQSHSLPWKNKRPRRNKGTTEILKPPSYTFGVNDPNRDTQQHNRKKKRKATMSKRLRRWGVLEGPHKVWNYRTTTMLATYTDNSFHGLGGERDEEAEG